MTRRAFISLYVIAAVAVICLVCLAIIARNWSCRQRRPPRPPRIETVGPYEVLTVTTGASLTVKVGKRRDRQVILDLIAAPATGEYLSSESADNLRKLAGKSVTVQYERGGLFRSANTGRLDEVAVVQADDGSAEGEVQPEAAGAEAQGPPVKTFAVYMEDKLIRDYTMPWVLSTLVHYGFDLTIPIVVTEQNNEDPPHPYLLFEQEQAIESRGPLTGIVFGESGINLNLAQVEAGYARCHDDAPEAWKKAEVKAKKMKFGVWSEVKK